MARKQNRFQSPARFLVELCDERLRGGGRLCLCNDVGITHGFAIERFVARFVRLHSGSVQAESRERSLGVSVKDDLCVGILVRGLPVSPRGRSICSECEAIRKQLGTQSL